MSEMGSWKEQRMKDIQINAPKYAHPKKMKNMTWNAMMWNAPKISKELNKKWNERCSIIYRCFNIRHKK